MCGMILSKENKSKMTIKKDNQNSKNGNSKKHKERMLNKVCYFKSILHPFLLFFIYIIYLQCNDASTKNKVCYFKVFCIYK